MTTFQVYIDGWPFLVEFEGTIEIERMWDGETVAIRGGPVKSVTLDEVELTRARAKMTEVHQQTLHAMSWFRSLDLAYRSTNYGKDFRKD